MASTADKVAGKAQQMLEMDMVPLALLLAKWLGIGLAVVTISLVGWAVSSINVLAGWDESAQKKLEILQGVLSSMSAGALGGLLGAYYEWPLILVVTLCFFGGYSGDKWLRPIAEAILQRVLGALSALFGAKPGDGKP